MTTKLPVEVVEFLNRRLNTGPSAAPESWRDAVIEHRLGLPDWLAEMVAGGSPIPDDHRAYLADLVKRSARRQRGRPAADPCRQEERAERLAETYRAALAHVRRVIEAGKVDPRKPGESPADAALRFAVAMLKREGIRATQSAIRRALAIAPEARAKK